MPPDIGGRAMAALRWWADEGLPPTSSILGTGAVERCEALVATHLGGGRGLALPSGTHALRTALLALGVGLGVEVIVPSVDWGAARAAVRSLGATTIEVAARGPTASVAVGDVVAATTPRTGAIVITDLFGWPADVGAIGTAVPGVPIVEDCAQALGGTRGGRPCGAHADIAVCSFGPGKVVDAGEGGALVTRDLGLWRAAVQVSQHPSRQRLSGVAEVDRSNLAGRIHPVAAIMACHQLADLGARVSALDRRARATLDVVATIPWLRAEPPGDRRLAGPAVPVEVDRDVAHPDHPDLWLSEPDVAVPGPGPRRLLASLR